MFLLCFLREEEVYMELFTNLPLWAALAAIGFAQFVKVPLHFIVTRKVDWSLITSTGGMPSSHSAAVTALTTGIALEQGVGSPFFAISTVFAVIVMFDDPTKLNGLLELFLDPFRLMVLLMCVTLTLFLTTNSPIRFTFVLLF